MNFLIRASRSRAAKFFCTAHLFFSGVFAADVTITSEQKGAETIAIGFTDFKCTKGDANALPFKPGVVIAWDLDFSGRFKVRSAPVFDSTSKGMFKAEGALAYVKGEYTLEGDNFTLNTDLVDIETAEKIISKK